MIDMTQAQQDREQALVIDDDPYILGFMADALEDEGLEVTAARDPTAALDQLAHHRFDIVFSDIRMPQVSGLEVLKAIKVLAPETIVVMITGYASVESAVQAIKNGAHDYLEKPLVLDRISSCIVGARQKIKSSRPIAAPNQQWIDTPRARMIIGHTPKMKEILGNLPRIAASEGTVLIQGESGTGKELLAQAIHLHSLRSQAPFIAVSCGALSETLLESELFGHERGAFTDAIARKAGRFELADGGTLFLDEIAEMSPAMQVKLLRVLQEREFERVGGTRTISIDVRVIAATNRNLSQALQQASFRSDLYYRLNVIPIFLPPLRNRKRDLPLLCHYLLEKFSHRANQPPKRLSPQAQQLLEQYHWPGNIRELENCLERAIILSRGDTIMPQHLGLGQEALPEPQPSVQTLEEAAKNQIVNVLRQTKGNRTTAAKILGINRNTLYHKIEKYDLLDQLTIDLS